tara:strand:+ start:425 stop:541 length:117 start_codon:yes stop_codon:yes gene_type:complete
MRKTLFLQARKARDVGICLMIMIAAVIVIAGVTCNLLK